jgi:hypothetical protein
MLKHLSVSFLALCSISLSACGNLVTLTQPPPPEMNYAFPLKVLHDGECGLPDRTAYEIDASGRFTFLEEISAEETVARKTVSLTAREQTDLQALLSRLDPLKLRQASENVPDDAPQTKECRTVETLEVQVSNQAQSLDRNSRKYRHSEAYRAAMTTIMEYLDTLRNKYLDAVDTPAPSAYTYALPLKVVGEGECDMGIHTHYEITADGKFSMSPPEGDGTSTRTLSETERRQLLATLARIDIAKAAEADQAVPADAPQTEECRTVSKYTLQVNGQPRTFDANGRTLTHSEGYRQGLRELQQLLEELSRGPLATPESGAYGLPLTIQAEGECGMPSYARYQLNSEGYLQQQTHSGFGETGAVSMTGKQLTADQRQGVLTLMTELKLADLAKQLQPVPSDAPQTADCRTVEAVQVRVGGEMQTLPGRGTRKFQLTDAYRSAVEKLVTHLEKLML